MEQDSCQSAPIPSESECDEDDSAFAKTPIRALDSASDVEDDDTSSESSSNKSAHINDHGDRTYFHVWGDMLTCGEMSDLDQKADNEMPNYVEGEELTKTDVHKPLSIDTSMPCPLIQFGPIPKRRPKLPSVSTTETSAGAIAEPVKSAEAPYPEAAAAAVDPECCSASNHEHSGERCCDFSIVAAQNKARLKREEKMRRKERRKLIRY